MIQGAAVVAALAARRIEGNVVTDEQLDWKRVGDAVAARRGQLGFKSQEDAAEAADVGVQTWREIENAQRGNYRRSTLARVAFVLGWPANMILRIAAGEDPPEERSADRETLRQLQADVAALRGQMQVVLDILQSSAPDRTTDTGRGDER